MCIRDSFDSNPTIIIIVLLLLLLLKYHTHTHTHTHTQTRLVSMCSVGRLTLTFMSNGCSRVRPPTCFLSFIGDNLLVERIIGVVWTYRWNTCLFLITQSLNKSVTILCTCIECIYYSLQALLRISDYYNTVELGLSLIHI